MRSNASLDARKASTRAGKLPVVARKACALILLLTLAAPFCVVGAGAQSRKSPAPDESAQDAKEKEARKAKDKKEKDAREEKDDDSQDKDSRGADDAKDKDGARTPWLIAPAPLMRGRPAPSSQSKALPAAQSTPAPSIQTQSATRPTQTKTAQQPQAGAAQAPRADGAQVSGLRASPVSVTRVNFRQLAEQAASTPLSGGPQRGMAIHAPLTVPDPVAPDAPAGKRPKTSSSSAPAGQEAPAPAPAIASPSPSQSFLAQEDSPRIGGDNSGFSFIPPDTQGAVGLDKVFVNTNGNYRVQDKLTGTPLSTVGMGVLWSGSGGSGFFDPRITFDPYNKRWILAAVSNAETAQSSIELAVSDTSDPQGAYHVYRFVVGCAINTTGCVASGNPFGEPNGEWADFPMLGFNKNWVAVSVNMFGNFTDTFIEGRVLVLDYPTLRTGTASAKLFAGSNIGFCLHPVETYDPNETTLYLPQHVSAAAQYKLSTITGTPAAPALTIGATRTRPGGGWQRVTGNSLPQTCTGTCPSGLLKIDAGDDFIRGNAVFRNSHVYYTQTVGLPSTGATHTAAQWTKLNTDGTFADGGRVEDPTATDSNGGKWYAYPTIAVNKADDFLIGFSQFASNQFASAGYAYHDHTDAAGTTRDPFIFKAGEDYYGKTFGGGRNRWGDYSHTVVDPVNDTDIWTIQEYAQLRTPPDTSADSFNAHWGTWWAKLSLANPGAAGQLIISEFRLRGPGGAQDEYVEIYNASGGDITVQASDGSSGYGLFASDGTLRFAIPNGTFIPARGHYLGVGAAYSLGSYPAGGGTTATGDAVVRPDSTTGTSFPTDIADNAGIALFNTADQTHLLTATRFDAVGSSAEANTLFKEGNGYPAVSVSSLEYAFVRDMCGKGGSTSAAGPCPADGSPKDTGDNASDFIFVAPTGADIGAGARIGAPGPENSHSPAQRNDTVTLSLLDPAAGSALSPNRFRDPTPNTPNAALGPFGTLSIRRTVTNNTGQAVTRLRFRIIDVSTAPVPLGTADLRAVTSGATPTTVIIAGSNPACPSNTCTVQQTTLETPPAQPGGGGFNSTLTVTAVVLGTPIPPGGSINVQLLLGVRQPGSFRVFVNVEAETAAP